MTVKHILHVVGARPNFMKIAPIMRVMAKWPDEFAQKLIHTGQHYDAAMSQVFFDELDLPRPDVNLEVGSGSHAQQTAQIMQKFEPILLEAKPDWILVPGDVNSTLACALVAVKLGIRVAHVEAGLRSFDRTMPEEINRLVTDQISDLLFTPSQDGNENLLREGIKPEKIHFVGNVMIDTLVQLLPKAQERWFQLRDRWALHAAVDNYVLATLHRPANVDDPKTLQELLLALTEIAQKLPIIFPVHPRTRKRISDYGLIPSSAQLQFIDPLGYLDFLALQLHARFVLTDSGGVQEETTYLGIPCLTIRPNTERPITVTHGSNQLIASSRAAIIDAAETILGKPRSTEIRRPPLWDGYAAERIVQYFRAMD